MLACAVFLVLSGCSNGNGQMTAEQERINAVTQKVQKSYTTETVGDFWVNNYGNGVYYFPYCGNWFPCVLSTFLSIHTNLEVSGIAPDVAYQNQNGLPNSSYGATVGHNVTFKEKK